MSRALTLAAALAACSSCGWAEAAAEGGSHRIWYRQPADLTLGGWERESIPIGCGWFGANVFGGVTNERIQVTHNAVLTNYEHDGRPNLTDGLEIVLRTDHAGWTDYTRGLDLDASVAWTRYTCRGTEYSREIVASYPGKAMAIRLSAKGAERLSFTLAAAAPFTCPFGTRAGKRGVPGRTADYSLSKDGIDVYQQLEYFGILFDSQLKIVTDGKVEPTEITWSMDEPPVLKATFKTELSDSAPRKIPALRVVGATTATVYFACDTNYRLSTRCFSAPPQEKLDRTDPRPAVSATLAAAVRGGYDRFLAAHQADVRKLLGRVAVDLGGDPADGARPTDELLRAYQKGADSPYLEECYFRFGRHLLVSSSRPGTLPANLQGIWSAYRYSPWGCGYWHNINVQMNYWPAFITNLAECFEPYADYCEAYRPAVRKQTVEFLRRVVPENAPRAGEETDVWYIGTGAWPYSASGYVGGHSGPGNGGLTTCLFMDWWEYTQNRAALEKFVWPAVHGMADFMSRCVVASNGLYLARQSASPEQCHPRGTYYQTIGCAYDQQMIFENNANFLKLAKLLGREDDPVVRRVKEQVAKYDPVQVGASGQIKEFREESKYGEIGEYRHRHISQLVGLMPGTQITANRPDLMAAAKYTLTERGDDSTGWALAHRLCAWSRLGDGDHAHRLLQVLLRKKTNPNLWDEHPPFQIDGNFGAVAGMAEMLLQSHAGFIDLLPALPQAWAKRGSFRGLCARGAFEIDCEWRDGKPTRVVVRSRTGARPDVRFRGQPCRYE